MSIIQELANDNFIVVNKTLIRAFGLEEAIIIGELCSEYNYWKKQGNLEDDMFYSTMENIEENTGLSPYQQRKAIKNLEKAGVIRTELKGMPAVKWFAIDESQLLKNFTSRCEKTSQQDVKKLHLNNNKNNNKNKTIPKGIVQDLVTGSVKKKNTYQKCIDLINGFTEDPQLKELLVAFLKVCLENSRESGKSFYTNMFKGKLDSLTQLSTDTSTQIQIVNHTLQNGWCGFYPLKDEKRSYNRKQVSSDMNTGYEYKKADKQLFREEVENGIATKF